MASCNGDRLGSRSIVIGVGNRWRHDDGVGPYVAARIADSELPSVQVYTWESECSGLLEIWYREDRVCIVDAALGDRAGTVHRFDADTKCIPADVFRRSSHEFGVAEAVELARTLGHLPRSLTVYGIVGVEFGYGQGLSAEVETAAQQLIGELTTILAVPYS